VKVNDVNHCTTPDACVNFSEMKSNEKLKTKNKIVENNHKIEEKQHPANIAMCNCDGYHIHKRLGHCSIDNLRKAIKDQTIPGFKKLKKNDVVKILNCEVCRLSKIRNKPFFKLCDDKLERRTGSFWYLDVSGHINPVGRGGFRYHLTAVDPATRYLIVKPMKTKHASEILSKWKEIVRMVGDKMDLKIRGIRTDGGGEFVNEKFDYFCKSRNISREITCPYSSSSNGVAERAIQR